MLQIRSVVKVADNTGAKLIRVFTVYGGSRKRYAYLGQRVNASVQAAEPRKAIKKKEIVKCIVIRTAAPIRRADGTVLRFDENAVVIVDEKGKPKGTRIFGPVPRELKEMGFTEIFSLAEEVV